MSPFAIKEKMTLSPITPVKPVAPYIGGKMQLAKHVAHRVHEVPHKTYVEPFVGMGGVFFRRAEQPKCEVINDVSGDVVTLFRILQRHYPQFLEVLKFQLTSRSEFERLSLTDPTTLTDLERAARFLYLQRTSFGGKVVPLLEDVHERLSGVIIENLAYADCIKRYDRPDTLFYLDPPYWACETYYGKGVFSADDFQKLADQLAGIQGRFLLSINDAPEIREVFASFEMEEVGLNYTVNPKSQKKVQELIISN